MRFPRDVGVADDEVMLLLMLLAMFQISSVVWMLSDDGDIGVDDDADCDGADDDVGDDVPHDVRATSFALQL